MESLALQSLMRWPSIGHELGITADYWRTQTHRKALAEAALSATSTMADGSLPLVTTAASANVPVEWLAMEFNATLQDPAIGRSWLRELAVAEQNLRLKLRVDQVFRKSEPEEIEDALMSALVGHQRQYRNSGTSLPSMRDAALAFTSDWLLRQSATKHKVYGFGRNMPRLTEILRGGFHRGEVTALVAGPGVGKSTLAEFFRRQLAEQKIYTILFSAEMTEEQLAERFVHAELRKRLAEALNATDIHRAVDLISRNDYAHYMLHYEAATLTAEGMLAIIRATEGKVGPVGLAVVDHVAKVRKARRNDQRQDWEMIAEAAVDTKEMAKSARVAALILAHMTTQDGAQEDPNWEPSLAAIRGGGKLANEVDNAIALWRVGTRTRLKILKCRQNGEAKGQKIELGYESDSQSFTEVSGW